MNKELKLHAKPKELLIGQELAGFGAIRKGMEAAEIEAVKRQVLKGGCPKRPTPAAG
jgi:hypothetical protein